MVNWICVCWKTKIWRFCFIFTFLKGNYDNLKPPRRPILVSAKRCRRSARAPPHARWPVTSVREVPRPTCRLTCGGPHGVLWFKFFFKYVFHIRICVLNTVPHISFPNFGLLNFDFHKFQSYINLFFLSLIIFAYFQISVFQPTHTYWNILIPPHLSSIPEICTKTH